MDKVLRQGDLPVHPRTGLTALYVDSRGRARYPMLGGDENGATAAETAAARALREFDAETQTMRSELLQFETLGSLDDTQTARFNELDTAYTAREAARAPLVSRVERMAQIREQFEANEGVEGGEDTEGASRSDNGGGSSDVSRSSASNSTGARGRGRDTRRTNPFEGYLTARAMPVGDVVTRARRSLDQVPDWQLSDTQRSRIDSQLAGDNEGKLARHIMAGQNPDYVSAFEKIARGDVHMLSLTETERAAVANTHDIKRGIVEGTGSAGGFLVPPYFDPTIIHTAEDSVNPLRELCTVKTINGPTWNGVSMGSVSAGYVGETVEINESTPAYGNPSISTHKLGAYIKASTEALEDTSVAGEMAGLLQEAKDEAEAHEFLLGDGQTGHIRGMVPALVAADTAADSTHKLLTVTAASLVWDQNDLYSLLGAVPARYRTRFQWLAEFNFYLKARTLAGNNNLGAFWTDLNGDNPPKIAGKATNEASQMATLNSSGAYTAGQVIALGGDFKSAYYIIDRRGMVIEFDAMVKGTNGRPTGERGWYGTWRTGGDMVLPRALRGLKVKA